ncbi:MAG TPA: 50S ribosomal protein L30e, partial [Candidatus Methanoperedenaceae archaeon]|nr:50S ribosomal protein L30e [Candidatus Methanoperedenaceae archaeon]
QLAVIASNCPKDKRDKITGVPVMDFPGKGTDLGTACGKPYPIAALAIVEAGESDILRAVREK